MIPPPDKDEILSIFNSNPNKVNLDIDTGIPAEGTTFWTFSWTARNPALRAVFRNQFFRQAMSHLSDREEMKKVDFFDYATSTHFPLNPLSPYHIQRSSQTEETKKQAEKAIFPFDPEKARALLDKIGLRLGSDGKRFIPANFDGEGNPQAKLEFTLTTNREVRIRELMVDRLIADAARLGITIRKEIISAPELAESLIGGNFEAALFGLGGGFTPESSANVFMCEGNLHFYHVECPKNPTAFEKQVDALFRNGASEQDNAKERQIWDRWQLLMGQHQPLIYLVQPHLLFVYRIDTLRNHGRAPSAVQDLVYCIEGKCIYDRIPRPPDDKGNKP
jgi:ABC-type transport system substrate-binding protein